LNTHSHLEESLQRDIDLIQTKILEMSGLSQRAVDASLQALTSANRQLAYSVILRDQYIDELETELDRLCLEFLVRQQPVAGHLRFVFTTIQINKELERIGDYAESIARQVLAISGLETPPHYGKFVELGNLSIHMLRDAIQSFLNKDADLASRTMAIEERANSLRNSLNGELTDSSQKGGLPTAALNSLLTVARRFEGVADQAKNICEEVLYMCTGEFIKHKGADAFRILFLDLNDACLSQMAAGVGNSLGQPRFVFASAGLTPQPVNARAVEFMAAKGIDISRQTSKSLEQVANWEHYQVVVALSTRVQDALPVRPSKTIFFTWAIPDPSEVAGTPEQVQNAFQAAYQALDTNIRELVGAILEEPRPELKL
jgi:phosphate transport system protein